MSKKNLFSRQTLFPRTSFFQGIGSSFNVFGNYYTFRRLRAKNADEAAIASDWSVVGKDLRDVMNDHEIRWPE